MKSEPIDALIVVDVQNDFLPGGALAVPDGDSVIPVINKLVPQFDMVVATQDWHPKSHGSFVSQHSGKNVGDEIELNGLLQRLWPEHCVQNTKGADFAADLSKAATQHVFQKGTDVRVDSYSGFFDNGGCNESGLAVFLKTRSVGRVFVTGLATNFCVKFTALDAKNLGFDVVIVEDACRGIEINSGDVAEAVRELEQVGVTIVQSESIVELKCQ